MARRGFTLLPISSELPRPAARPPLHHNLFLREEFHGVTALAVQVSEETSTRSAEWKERHRRCDGNVDPDITHFRVVAERPRGCAVRGEQTRLISIRSGIHKLDGRRQVLYM